MTANTLEVAVDQLPFQDTVRELRDEIERFSKVSHLVWSTWSVIQVTKDKINDKVKDKAKKDKDKGSAKKT